MVHTPRRGGKALYSGCRVPHYSCRAGSWMNYDTGTMPFRSPYPDVQIPNVSLPELLFSDIGSVASQTAIVDGPSGRGYTYGQLADLTGRVAAALARRGLRKGDKLAILSPNLPEYAIAVHAVMRAGGTVTRGQSPRRHRHHDEPALHRAGDRTSVARR